MQTLALRDAGRRHGAGSEKMQEFERGPFGIIGLETALPLALEMLVHPGRITLNRMVELFTTGPESVLRLGRGTLAPGAPGDVTIFSTSTSWTYDVNQSPSRSRNSPFHGRTFRGGPVATIVNTARSSGGGRKRCFETIDDS